MSTHPLCKELENCLKALSSVDAALVDRSPPGEEVASFLAALSQLEAVTTAHPEVKFPAAALDKDADWDTLTCTTLRDSLVDIKCSENRRRHARDLADLVEAAF